jgi:hypothetical protein
VLETAAATPAGISAPAGRRRLGRSLEGLRKAA